MQDLSSFFAKKIFATVQAKYKIDDFNVTIERPKEKSFGDFSTNIAMVLCKRLNMTPRQLAEEIVETLSNDNSFKSLNTAGPGFINWFVSYDILREQLYFILSDEFHNKKTRNGKTINIEYVSANPTGPLHAVPAQTPECSGRGRRYVQSRRWHGADGKRCGYPSWKHRAEKFLPDSHPDGLRRYPACPRFLRSGWRGLPDSHTTAPERAAGFREPVRSSGWSWKRTR